MGMKEMGMINKGKLYIFCSRLFLVKFSCHVL